MFFNRNTRTYIRRPTTFDICRYSPEPIAFPEIVHYLHLNHPIDQLPISKTYDPEQPGLLTISTQKERIAGIEVKVLDRVVKKLKKCVRTAQEASQRKQEKLDKIEKVRKYGVYGEKHLALGIVPGQVIVATIVNDVVIKLKPACGRIGPGTYKDESSFSYIRGVHSYNVMGTMLFQEVSKQPKQKMKETTTALYSRHAHEAALFPSLAQQKMPRNSRNGIPAYLTERPVLRAKENEAPTFSLNKNQRKSEFELNLSKAGENCERGMKEGRVSIIEDECEVGYDDEDFSAGEKEYDAKINPVPFT